MRLAFSVFLFYVFTIACQTANANAPIKLDLRPILVAQADIESSDTPDEEDFAESPEPHDYQFQEKTHYFTLFSPKNGEDGERLWSQTKAVFGYGFLVFGAIYAMPVEDTHWDKSGFHGGNLFKEWKKNVTTRPQWDKDSPWFNYVAHPYVGGSYYQVARNSGYGQFDSFTYAALMSTFYWEYGVESLVQPPSIQDLIVTPLGGWLYGEWAFNRQHAIKSNGGELWGSTALGSIALFFLDPVDNMSVGFNKIFGKDIIKTGSVWISQYPRHAEPVVANQFDGYLGLDIQIVF